jgi:hypothetical protein
LEAIPHTLVDTKVGTDGFAGMTGKQIRMTFLDLSPGVLRVALVPERP